jgi:hypothetical protein
MTPPPPPISRKPPTRGKRKPARKVAFATASWTRYAHDVNHTELTAVLPLRLVSEANAHEHWRKRQGRAKEQRATVAAWFRQHTIALPRLPLVVTLTRLAPSTLDSDNCVGAAKHCRDGVADWLGIDDRDARVEWRVGQEKAPHYGVRIVVQEMSGIRRIADLRAQLEAAEAAMAAEKVAS